MKCPWVLVLATLALSACTFPTQKWADTLAGPDADGNGIRDDIDAYINGLPDMPEQKRAVMQTARALQAMVLVDGDASIRSSSMRMYMAALNCLDSQFAKSQSDRVDQIIDQLEKSTFDTPLRVTEYMRFNNAISGMSFVLPSGVTCE